MVSVIFINRLKGLAEMNPKVANLIAVELGILIGIMSWLAYSRFPSAEPRTATRMQEGALNPVATVADVFEPGNTVDYETDHEPAQPVDEEAAPIAPEYDQEIVTQPYTSSGLGNGYVAADSPSYAEVDQESTVVPPDYMASPQIVVYAQPTQIVLFSNPRRVTNRCRSIPRHGAVNPITHRCPDRRNSPLSDTTIASGPNVSTPSCPPIQGPRPRGTVRQSVVTGSQQKRVAFPGSPGAARRSLSVP